MSQVGGIGAVITTDDEHGIQRFLQQLEKSILAVLRSTANGIEHMESGIITITSQHGVSEHALNMSRFALEHGCLVSHTNFRQMHIRVKSRGAGICKACHEGGLIAVPQQVIHNHLSFIL